MRPVEALEGPRLKKAFSNLLHHICFKYLGIHFSYGQVFSL